MPDTDKLTVTLMVTGMIESNVTLAEILEVFEVDPTILNTFDEGDVKAHVFGVKSDEDDEGSVIQIIEKTGSKIPLTVSCDDEDVIGLFVIAAAKAGFEVHAQYFPDKGKLFCAHLFRRATVQMGKKA